MSEIKIARAYISNVSQSPRKISLVASLIRRRRVDDALVILAHTPKRAVKPVIKAIESARANAINNLELDSKTLVISQISVTIGTRLKRFTPASRGRALPFQKKSSNILVEVSGNVKPKKSAVKKDEAKAIDEVAKSAKTVKKEEK